MDWKIFFATFGAIFIAEMGDKTQLSVLGFSTEAKPLPVFLGAMAAFFVVTLLAVIVGAFLSKYINPKYLHYGAGVLFILIGVWTLIKA